MKHIIFEPTCKRNPDWRPEYLARRHRIDSQHARLYLAWSADRWERKA